MESDSTIEIDQSPKNPLKLNPIKIYEYLLDHNGVIPPEDLGDGYFSETRLDPDVLKEAVDEEVVNATEYDKKYKIPETVISSEFDWNSESRRSLRDAIDILFKSGLVSRDQLVKASKFAGPDSIAV